ncbi:MAG: hypothetical protein GY940_33525 [bacterium]|nr:hypothetical protein [bacterium]
MDSLIERFGFDPLYHPHSGFLPALHAKTLPGGLQTGVIPIERFQPASPSGGFTVLTYGSNRPGGINSFHMECSLKLRTQWLEQAVEIYADAIQTLYRNILADPYITETVFAGKLRIGGAKGRTKRVAFEFSLKRMPRKNYPVMVIIHSARTKSDFNTVILNDSLLGCLKPRNAVTSFEAGDSGTARLRKSKNVITISSSSSEGGLEDDDFDLLKIDVMYCGL